MTRGKFAVLTVGGLCDLRYRRALTAHPIDVVLYSGIIKRILQTVEVCGILFAIRCFRIAVLMVGKRYHSVYAEWLYKKDSRTHPTILGLVRRRQPLFYIILYCTYTKNASLLVKSNNT